jgi:putative ABC transport system permease protein
MFVVSAAVIFLALRLVAVLTMALARRLPRQRSTLMRLAVTNIYRPGALTPSVVLSLGLGLSLLVTLVEIDGNLHRQFAAALPEKAPSFFFIDIASADADRFDAFVRAQTPGATLERVPMLRGRIIAAGGTTAVSPMRRPCRPARAWSPANGGPPTIPVRRWFRLSDERPTISSSRSATPSRSTCSAAT